MTDYISKLAIVPALRVGMQPAPLRRCMTRSVTVGIPTETARRYTQVLETRHSGRDAGIHRPRMANCGSRPMRLYSQTVTRAFIVAYL